MVIPDYSSLKVPSVFCASIIGPLYFCKTLFYSSAIVDSFFILGCDNAIMCL